MADCPGGTPSATPRTGATSRMRPKVRSDPVGSSSSKAVTGETYFRVVRTLYKGRALSAEHHGDVMTDTSPTPSGAASPRGGFARTAFWTSASAAVLPLLALVTGPLLARALGPEGRGEMAAAIAPVFVLVFVASMAVPEAVVYAVARLHVPLRRTAFVAALLLLVYGTVAALGLFLVSPLLLRNAPNIVSLERTICWFLPALMLGEMLRYAVTGARQFRLANIERVTMALARLIVLVALFMAGALTTAAAVWVNVLVSLSVVVLLPALLKSTRDKAQAVPVPALARRLALFGLLGWGGAAANLISRRLDLALLAALTTPRQIGYYAVAVSLAEVLSLVVAAMKNVLFAEVSRRGNLALIARVSRTLVGVISPLALAGVIVAPIVVRLLFGDRFAPATDMARVLLLATVPFSLEVMMAAGLLSLGLPGRRSVGQVVAAVVTVVGLFVLVPRLGALGAAWTSLGAYTVNMVITALLLKRATQLSFRDLFVPRLMEVRGLVSSVRSQLRMGRRRRGHSG